jgi:hypothetical protein
MTHYTSAGGRLCSTNRARQELLKLHAGTGRLHPRLIDQPETVAVALADHKRNLADCRMGAASCDRSKLTPAEDNALTVVWHQHNVSDCMEGWGACDRSKLTPSEANGVAEAERRRNISNCIQGWSACDQSKLTERKLKMWLWQFANATSVIVLTVSHLATCRRLRRVKQAS